MEQPDLEKTEIERTLDTIESWGLPEDDEGRIHIYASRRDPETGKAIYLTGWRKEMSLSELREMAWVDDVGRRFGSGEYLFSVRWRENGQCIQRALTLAILAPNPSSPERREAPAQTPPVDEEAIIEKELRKWERIKNLMGNGDGNSVISLDQYLAIMRENSELQAKVMIHEELAKHGIGQEPETPLVASIREVVEAFKPHLGTLINRMGGKPGKAGGQEKIKYIKAKPGARGPVHGAIPRQKNPPPAAPPAPDIEPAMLKKGLEWLHENMENLPPDKAVEYLSHPEAPEFARKFGFDLEKLITWFKAQNPMSISRIIAQTAPELSEPGFVRYITDIWRLVHG